MYKSAGFVITLSMIITVSCGEKKENIQDRETMYNEIREMEKNLFNEQMGVDEKKAMEMISKYNDYAALFPEDTSSAKFLFLAADIAGSISKPKIKVQNYTAILEKYPDFKGKEHVLYLLAFTYDFDMDKREEAKKYYQQVVSEAKDTNFIRDARIRLSTIDRMSYQQYLDSIFAVEPATVQ